MQRVTIRNRTLDTEVCRSAECADGFLTRLVGLIGRGGLEAGDGLWIRPSSGIHTFGMRFTIDAIGLDRHLRVVRLWASLKPFRLSSVSWNVRSVLELPAGHIHRCSVEVGHYLETVSVA